MKTNFTLMLMLLVSMTVSAQVPFTATFPVISGNDDAEESTLDGGVNLGSSDLEMTRESTVQLIGIRFANINIPKGASINSAYIQFTVDETNDEATNLLIQAEDAVNPMTFTNAQFDISSRPRLDSSVMWSDIPAWNAAGLKGADQRTPDLTSIINVLINQDEWAEGNAMVFIISGEGKRNAISFNNGANSPAELVINYDISSIPVSEFPFGSQSLWSYNDEGIDLDTAWRELAFNDSSWQFGQAKFGYGDDNETTTLDFGPDPDNKIPTYYFRKKFTVSGVDDIDELNLSLLRDDGAVVYLNGQEIVRSNMPEGEINFNTLAAVAIGGPEEETFFNFTIDPTGLLLEGENLLAVEVHQGSPGSSDLGFDLSLGGVAILPPAIQLIHNAPDPTLGFASIYIDVGNTGNFVNFTGDTPVPFRVATEYISDLPAGTHSIAVSPFGQGDFMWSATEFTVESNKRYIVMAIGVRDTSKFETTFNSSEAIAFRFQVNEVPGEEVVSAGDALALLSHGTPDLPNIRIIAAGAGDATEAFPEGLPYGFDLAGGTVDALSYPIVQITNNATTEIFGEYKVDLVPYDGQVVTIFTSGFFTAEGDEGVNNPNFGLYLVPASGGFAIPLPAPDAPVPGKIQIIHNALDPELNQVDIWLDGEKVVDSLDFREATGVLDIPVGQHRVAVSPTLAAEVDTAWSATTIEIDAVLNTTLFRQEGLTYTVMAYGVRDTNLVPNSPNEDVSFGLAITESRLNASNETDTDFILFHGAPDVAGIDAILDGQFIPIVNNLAFGSFSPIYVSLPASTNYRLNVTPEDDNSTIVKGYRLDFAETAGEALTVFASGVLTLETDLLPAFGLFAVDTAGGFAISLSDVTSVEQDLKAAGISVYPNPVQDRVIISSENRLQQIRLMNLEGREIKRVNKPAMYNELKLDDLASGVYLLELRNEENVFFVRLMH